MELQNLHKKVKKKGNTVFHIIITARINLKEQLYRYTWLIYTEIYNLLLDLQHILSLLSRHCPRMHM